MKKPKTFYSQSFEIQEYLNWQEQQIKELKVQNKSYAAHEKEVLDKFNQDKSLEQQIKKLKDEKDLETLAKNDLQERNEIQFKQSKELEDALIGMAELDIIITSKTESILNKAKQTLKK